jgi:hypothetical protein
MADFRLAIGHTPKSAISIDHFRLFVKALCATSSQNQPGVGHLSNPRLLSAYKTGPTVFMSEVPSLSLKVGWPFCARMAR